MNKIKAILFDLDGTLLDNHMGDFLPHYLTSLAARFSHMMDAKTFIARLLAATEVMQANDGRMTNEAAFAGAFFPLAGHSRSKVESIINDFYLTDFPRLQQYTRLRPEARLVVQLAFALGYQVAIATNPLFPRIAVMQRLAWAGVDDFPYQLITSYENSRACKPNLRYFADIARALRLDPTECLVVGDEDMDMVAARIGCTTYLVPGPATALRATTPEPLYSGSLADLAQILESSVGSRDGFSDDGATPS